ncbi:MAG: class I SAM-dependent methyltransferase [Pyrinomonadaceae bacterium]
MPYVRYFARGRSSSRGPRFSQCEVICGSILNTGFSDNYFDCAAVVGGLHHLHPNLNGAVTEIHRILKPSGYFCFVEPHAGSLPDLLRQFWYKYDTLFASNEAAIQMGELTSRFSDDFAFLKLEYMGNLAYLLVFNSMVFRVPLWLKQYYTTPLVVMESIINKLQGRRLSCYVAAQWRKK